VDTDLQVFLGRWATKTRAPENRGVAGSIPALAVQSREAGWVLDAALTRAGDNEVFAA
jgi:hypothetical protein